jgi:hypothetical protein
MDDLSRAGEVARELAPAVAESADEIARARRITEPLLGKVHASRLSACFTRVRSAATRSNPRSISRRWRIGEIRRFCRLALFDRHGLAIVHGRGFVRPGGVTGTREDPSLRREPGPLYAFPQQTLYSVGIASVALGIARGMLDAFRDLACRKTPCGTSSSPTTP